MTLDQLIRACMILGSFLTAYGIIGLIMHYANLGVILC